MRDSLPFEHIERQILVRKEAESSGKFGLLPGLRPVEKLLEYGIVNIDKPKGPTSHQVSAYVQQILGLSKSGHSGTLDPKVTGVLPVAFGRATRIVQTILSAGKEYVAIMHLHDPVPDDKLKKVCSRFTGKIKQLPPIKSSVKRRERFRKVYYLNILESDGQDILIQTGTQAGTYIRKLIHDIGQELGCGAHMAELRRTKAGPFKEDTAVTLQDLSDALHYYREGKERYLKAIIQPPEAAVEHLPKVWVLDTSVDTLCHGSNLAVPGIAKVESAIGPDESVAIMTLKDELVALGKTRVASKEMLGDRGMAVNVEKVFMEPETYPKIQR